MTAWARQSSVNIVIIKTLVINNSEHPSPPRNYRLFAAMSTPPPITEMRALEPGSLHVWLTRLERYCQEGGENEQHLTAGITDAELVHANAFRLPAARHRYLQVRCEVRQCLARYTHLHPLELELARSEQGKPFLKNTPLPLDFNLSHSGEYLALVVSAGSAVGIDLEQVSARRSWQAIAQRFFHPEEFAQLMALPEVDREQGFYRYWTLKEAFFKARGTGISTGLEKAIFNLRNSKIDYRFAAELNEDTACWQFQQGQWNLHYHLAIACKEPCERPLAVCFFEGGGVTTTISQHMDRDPGAPVMVSSA